MFDCRWIRVISSSASRKERESNTRTRRRESPSSSPSALRWSGNTVRSLTSRDGSRSYGTTLFYFEPLSTLFPRLFIRRSRWAVPAGCRRQKALCSQGTLSAVPPAHVLCLRHFLAVSRVVLLLTSSELYRNTISVSEDMEEGDTLQVRKSSFNSRLRKGSTCNVVDDDLIVECPGAPLFKSITASGAPDSLLYRFLSLARPGSPDQRSFSPGSLSP